jgi:flagellin-like protein
MNVLGTKERSWRKARKRGVSPIIATILLVAITVVLAAVLYVLVSGLVHGTGSPLLGSEFTWGTPKNISGASSTGCTGALTTYCLSVEIASAGTSLSTSDFYLGLQAVAGTTLAWPAMATVSLVSAAPAKVLTTYVLSGTGIPQAAWLATVPVASGDSVVFQTLHVGATGGVSNGLSGDQLVAIASNGYSGTVVSNPFS